MKSVPAIAILLIAIHVPSSVSNNHALFIKEDAFSNAGKRVARQTSTDQMVQNILQWLQGIYTQNSRRIRQGSLREYLPPTNTQKPRPFGPGNNENEIPGYPPSGSITPKPPFTIPPSGYPSLHPDITPPDKTPNYNGYPTSSKPQPPFTPTGPDYPTDIPKPTNGYPGGTTGYPESTHGKPPGTTEPSGPSTGYPGPGPSTGYPGTNTGYPGPSTLHPGPNTGFPTPSTGYLGPNTPPATQPPTGYPGHDTSSPQTTIYPSNPTFPTSSPRPFPTGTNPPPFTSPTAATPGEDNTIPGSETTKGPEGPGSEKPPPTSPPGDDDKHPPHIHAIDVECSKEMMTINIEFNRKFDGIIYSKGYYSNPDCRYVQENSGQTKYTFTLSLNACGTEFVNAFDTQGKSYLENILVLQNEPGIQEVWDTIRAVRCLWEGNLKKALNVAINVGMLNQEIVTFSGDTAVAQLDIRLGKGPFSPPANGLVKIGEDMTLVVSVTGDPGFDIQVKDCKARDLANKNSVALTDEDGCVLKPKVFGAFQKTRSTGDTGASIIAYAYFQAFKFPDVMDLTIECNVDLCKTDCEMCPDPNQPLEPGLRRRRRRDLYSGNSTDEDSVKMGKSFRVIVPEDLSDVNAIISLPQTDGGVCMSLQGFVLSSSVLITLLIASCLFSATLWIRYQRLVLLKH